MIQDISPKRLYNEYLPKELEKNDYIAVFKGNRILMRSLNFLVAEEFPAILDGQMPDASKFQYLFRIDGDCYFLYLDFNVEPCSLNLNPGKGDVAYEFLKITDIRYLAKREVCFAAYTAFHLYQWYRDSQFCGRCGSHAVPDSKERMLYCRKCGNRIYPRLSPAVIVAVTDGSKILLTKYAGREYKRYALIAGFAEIGETAEGTVRREVLEETGLHVKNIRYYKSQPWGIDGNLLFGYFAQLDGSPDIHIDKNELAVAEWVGREELKDMDDAVSLTREMMRVFYEGTF